MYTLIYLIVKEMIYVAILEAILTGEYQGQLTINRWHYLSSGDTGAVTPSFGLLSAMGAIAPTGSPAYFSAGTVLQGVQNVVSLAFSFKSFYIRNLYDPTDFVETAYSSTTDGNLAGQAASPLLAWGFTSGRIRTDIRRAMKRFAGVVEEGMGAGGTVIDPALTALNTLATRMSANLTYTGGSSSLTFTPAVLGLQEYTTPSGKRAYRFYPTEGAQLDRVAVGPVYQVVSTIRSQVSRQYSRGS